ncbi:PREDICTED: WRKY transcription factor 6-like isoform X3 [Populus euphratica]|uniref:WRKY transcription factor 6-like isoform X3 n=1 Tax=Populus euphratica TaxID=75702 RepID=A0AAJ6XAR2_POPEU|nr:PREDICTED: WRKY transcription factor 6-like isoform X3 [Populus euphratica]
MCISCNSIQVLSDHIWLFYLSFDHLKELKEWKHESFSNIELSFRSFQPGVKVKNCGVCLLSSVDITPRPSSAHFIVTSKEAASSFKAYLAFSSWYHQWKANVFPGIRVEDRARRFVVPVMKELEKVMTIRSRLFEAIEESGLSIIIFARDCASLTWCFEELVKIVGFMDEMRSDTVFPVSCDVEQSKTDDQTESYTIVFDKNEENSRENEEKVQRWLDILSQVEISSGSRSVERKSQAKKVVCIPAPAAANSRSSGEVVPSDLWAWRKYGQKPIKGSPYPRDYYRCSSSKGCSARKQVERSRNDPNMLVITYTSEHNHPWPTQRNALAGSTRSQPTKSNAASKSSTGAEAQKTANTKEDQKESSNDTSSPTDIIGGSSTASASVKEESDDIEKQMEMDDNEFSEGFSQSYCWERQLVVIFKYSDKILFLF